MPWKEGRKMDEKLRFVSRFPDGERSPKDRTIGINSL